LPGFALGAGSSTVVGQNLGAGNIHRARHGSLLAVKLYEIYIIPLGALFYVFAPQIASLFTEHADVISLVTKYLHLVPLSYPFFAVGTVLMRAINGAGKTIPPLVAMFVALYIVQLPVAYFLSSKIGPHGIWWSIAIGMVAQGIFIIPYFVSMTWAETGRFK